MFEAYGSPPLKPFQPSHSRPAPTATIATLFGASISRSRCRRGPITAAATNPDTPAETHPEGPQDPHDEHDREGNERQHHAVDGPALLHHAAIQHREPGDAHQSHERRSGELPRSVS